MEGISIHIDTTHPENPTEGFFLVSSKRIGKGGVRTELLSIEPTSNPSVKYDVPSPEVGALPPYLSTFLDPRTSRTPR